MAKKISTELLRKLAAQGKVSTLDGKPVKPNVIPLRKVPVAEPTNTGPSLGPETTKTDAPLAPLAPLSMSMVAALQAMVDDSRQQTRGILADLAKSREPSPPSTHVCCAPPTKWKFTVDRDPNNGLIREIIAIAVEE